MTDARTLLVIFGLLAAVVREGQFRVSVDAVPVDVLVTDRHLPVLGLTADHFELRDNGVRQHIESVSLDDVFISALLVLDSSVSLRGQPLQHLKDAASALLSTMRTEDRASMITFSHAIRIGADWSSPRARVIAAVGRIQADGLTALHDAAYAGLMLRDPEPGRRHLVLVFSDGADTASWLPGEAVIDLARRSDAVVYGVRIDNAAVQPTAFRLERRFGFNQAPRRIAPREYFREFLDELSEETGGEVFRTKDSAGLKEAFLRVLTAFRNRYLLTYTPRNVEASGWHEIEVKLKNRRGEVRARRGYQRGDPAEAGSKR
jgi:VWFA-related protein